MKLAKVLLANVWSDRNKGDYAITLGTIKCLKRIYPNVEIVLMSMFGANEFKYVSSEYRLLSSHADKVVGGLYPTYFSYGYEKMTRICQRILDIYSFFTSLVKLILISISRKMRARILPIKELVDSDLVILVGGNYINSSNVFGAIFYLFRVLYPALVCIILKKPYIMLGHTIWNINDVVSRVLLRYVVDRSLLVVVREEVSYRFLIRDIKTKNRVFVLPDLAFALANEVGNHKAIPRNSLIIGFSLRQWNFPKARDPKASMENYRKAISRFIEFLRTKYNAKILLIPLGSGPLVIEHDFLECLEIFKRVNQLGGVHIAKKPSSLQDIFELYSGLNIHVGVRLHSIIFASMCDVPSIAIGYQGHKTLGVAKQLGLSKYYVDITNVSAEKLILLFEKLQQESDVIKTTLSNRVKALHYELFTKLVYLMKRSLSIC